MNYLGLINNYKYLTNWRPLFKHNRFSTPFEEKKPASFGIIGDESRAPSNPPDYHSTIVSGGLRGGTHDFRETPVSFSNMVFHHLKNGKK